MAFVDTSTNNFQISAFGNAQISTSIFRYGGGSALFDGNGDYLEVVSNEAFNFGTGDFTIEAWIYLNSTPSDYFIASSNGTGGLMFGFRNNTELGWGRSLVAWDYSFASGIVTGQWYHVAVSRSGTSMRLFVNGNQIGTTQTNSTSYNLGTGNLAIGAQSNNYFLNGYIDGLRVTKGVARYIANFVPPTVAMQTFTDPYYNNVVLLLPMNPGPLVDSSTNNFTLSAFGNADISRTVTKYGNYSGYFDGTGDYLMAYTNQEFGTNNWTTEFWFRAESISGEPRMLSRQDAGTGFVYQLRIFNSAPQLLIRRGDGSGYLEVGGITTISTNQWYHIAIVRNGNTISMYIDGTLSDSKTFTGIYSSPLNAPWIIGAFSDSSINPQLYFQGYIDDLRITNGVARYTANFTPPQQQLPAPTDLFADNVSLLLHMDGLSGTQTFIDSSSNNFALSAFNNAQIATTVRRYGSGSAYFNGTSDYLQTPNLFSFASQNWTIEFWLYANTQSDKHIIANVAPGQDGINIYLDASSNITYNNGLNITSVGTSYTAYWNQWTHIALVRSGSTISMYVNGALAGTPTTQTPGTNQFLYIGKSGYTGYDFTGYIDDLRVTKGVARYTANFTPPTAPFPNPVAVDPYDGNVSLLLRMNGDNGSQTFLDSSTNKFPITVVGNAQISTAVKRFGTGSGLFDGNGDYLTAPQISFGTGDFTIECWVYLISRISSYPTIFGNYNTFGAEAISIQAGHNASPNKYNVWLNGLSPALESTNNIQYNTWTHIAVTRSGNTFRLFVDGVLNSTNTFSSSLNGVGSQISIGAPLDSPADSINGYIDDLRITKGVARYTSNFTPPTAPSPNPINLVPPGYIAFWKLNGLTDSSNNSNTLTNNGSVRFIPGLLGDCAQFTGSNSVYLQDSPISPAFNPSGVFTVSIWVYPRSFSNYQAFIGGPFSSFIIHTDSAGTLYCNEATSGDAQINNRLVLNTWQHIVFTKTAANRTRIWYNGVRVYDAATQNASNYQQTTNIVLGNYGNLNFPYDGLLDCVGLWNRELTQGEITQLYNTGLGLEP